MKLWEMLRQAGAVEGISTVLVTLGDGTAIKGVLDAYIQAADNDPEIESIDVTVTGEPGHYGLYANEIASVAVV